MLLSGTISSVVFGRLGDELGKRRMMLIALGSMVAGSVIGVVTESLPWLIGARVLQGVAMAMIPLGISALRDIMRGDQLFRGIALISAMAGIGGSLGFAVSAIAIAAQYFGLRGLFIGSAVLGALALAGVIVLVPTSAVSRHERVDVLGAAWMATALTALLVGVTNAHTWGWASATTLGLLGGAVVLLVGWGSARSRPYRRSSTIPALLLPAKIRLATFESMFYSDLHAHDRRTPRDSMAHQRHPRAHDPCGSAVASHGHPD